MQVKLVHGIEVEVIYTWKAKREAKQQLLIVYSNSKYNVNNYLRVEEINLIKSKRIIEG